MKIKIIVFVVTFSLLFSGILVAVEGGTVSEKETQIGQEIHDWYDLDNVRVDLSGDYVLMKNLDKNSAGYDELINTEHGWNPIGDDGTSFTGTFDGNGHEIRNLYIERSETDYIGLFGYTKGAKINNLSLVDADVSGKEFVGGLVGGSDKLFTEENKISDSYVSGDVTGYSTVGGLVGSNRHAIVVNSYSTASVNGHPEGNTAVGGLIGRHQQGTVSNCYATGGVTGGSRLGGLIGQNNARVNNSYAIGEVRGEEFVGGLIGSNNGGTVINSYSTGELSGNSEIGGLIGFSFEGTIINSYWDKETSGSEESDGGIGLTTNEMAGEDAPNNMDGFDFEEIWETVEENDDDAEEKGYPILQSLSREEQLKAQNIYSEETGFLSNYWWVIILIMISLTIAVGILIALRKKRRPLQQPSQQTQRTPSQSVSYQQQPPQKQQVQRQPPSQEAPSEEQPSMKEIPKEEAFVELSKLDGVGPSKAENLYENGFHSLEDLEGVSHEELQEVKGIGPGLAEKILDSLEKLK